MGQCQILPGLPATRGPERWLLLQERPAWTALQAAVTLRHWFNFFKMKAGAMTGKDEKEGKGARKKKKKKLAVNFLGGSLLFL